MKIRPVKAEMFHVDWRPINLTEAFRNFCEIV